MLKTAEKRLFNLARILLAITAIGFLSEMPGPYAHAESVSPAEKRLQEIVRDAQSVFDRGKELYRRGDRRQARERFAKCHRILLESDAMGDNDFQQRVDRVFHIFYEKTAAIDPDIAYQLQSIRKQVKRTYRTEPVYAGQVRYHMDHLLNDKRMFLDNSFDRALRYMPMIRREFAAAGIPEDLAYMALIESGFRPYPVSHAGAKGLWQFMPATARQYGLVVTNGIDERTDPFKATRAAARYLAYLYEKFGDWPLAVAAYNCGEGRVKRALEINNATSYWELVEQEAIPLETRRYVPSVIAATLIARSPGEYGFGP